MNEKKINIYVILGKDSAVETSKCLVKSDGSTNVNAIMQINIKICQYLFQALIMKIIAGESICKEKNKIDDFIGPSVFNVRSKKLTTREYLQTFKSIKTIVARKAGRLN